MKGADVRNDQSWNHKGETANRKNRTAGCGDSQTNCSSSNSRFISLVKPWTGSPGYLKITDRLKMKMNIVPPKKFSAECECPCCGWRDIHSIEKFGNRCVTRQCNQAGCGRKWKQEK